MGSSGSLPREGEVVASRYRIGEKLGKGGYGVVLAAHDEATGRDVALKILQQVTVEIAQRFWREAQIASQLDSIHIVRVFDTGEAGGLPFLAMERLRGRDLGALIQDGPLGPPRVADIVLQICEALAHAHGAGIVHRDIKTSNVFETDDGVVKVLDFGVSRIDAGANEKRGLTRTEHAGTLGSPPYMSPEHVRDPRTVDGRSDIWALGVLMYVLLSKKYPFDAPSVPQLYAEILAGNRRKLEADVPPVYAGVIAQCLANDPDDRFRDVGALAAALAPFASASFQRYGVDIPTLVTPLPPAEAARLAPDTRTIDPPEPVTITTGNDLAYADTVLAPPARAPMRAPWFMLAGLGVGVAIALAVLGLRRHDVSEPSVVAPAHARVSGDKPEEKNDEPAPRVAATDSAMSEPPARPAASALPRRHPGARHPHAAEPAPSVDPDLLPNPYKSR